MNAEPGQIFLKQAGTGKPLLLIHGLLMNGDMFESVFDSFAQHYRVLAPDLRGCSRSGNLPPPYTVERHAQDLAALLKFLAIPSVIALGYSHGGTVAQQLALSHPNLVSRLALACTFAYNQLTWREKMEGRIMPWMIRLLGASQLARAANGLTPRQTKMLEAIIASNDKSIMVEVAKSMLRFDSRARLHEIRQPTLVVAGGRDGAVPLHHAHMLVRGIPAAKLRVIQGAGHELIWTHEAEFVRAVHEFIDESH